ncbi:histidinol-phosphate transaminase [Paraburkholderia solisilvae]|uniref:Histidinol-phosphate aminotransferase n=1 Tax=Paraburkholderia solisilvae TaxID=624376 RepID=A0A6J5ECD0_9BURK|nr:histidinol-phosphate transaminase [Paraburkholderia solisilvae]CAB3763913.1 Histidinol-phosphate aminotransferase [Paraburkholderia solisilvae]
MTTPYGPSYVRGIAPYVAGRPIAEVARQFGLDEARIIKLASNENPLGMPESAQRAMARAASELGRYPDSNAFELKEALSAYYGVPADWITLGNGSNDILELAAHAFVEKGQSVVYSQYAFAIYALAAQGVGARGIVAPAAQYGHDLDAMLAAIADDTRLMFIANPNNPTGTFVDGPTLEAFLQKVPRHVVVVLDEAYTEYLAPEHRYDSIEWARRYPNLLVSRTFSKAFGLAGLRIGFAVAQPELTDLLNRLRQPFNVNTLAQAAAVAALNDKPFLEKSAALNAEGYRYLTAAFDKLGLEYVPSHGNFVMVRVGNDDRAGDRVNLELLKQGVIVRPVGGYGLPQWLRVTVGLPEENEAFLAALEKTLATV